MVLQKQEIYYNKNAPVLQSIESELFVIVSIPEECVTIHKGIASIASGDNNILPRSSRRARRKIEAKA
jgi:hypothetical protein